MVAAKHERGSPAAQTVVVAVVQQAREPDLVANRNTIIRYISQAKAQGCRLVVFPEDALAAPAGTPDTDVESAVDAIRAAARANSVYVVFCLSYAIPEFTSDRRGQRLLVINPAGEVIHRYNKLICNISPHDPRQAPGLFYIDGIPCSAMICADRWLRGVEELPVALGAKILFDCSANSRDEWIPELAWYLPVTRALRNGVFCVFCNMGEHPHGKDEPRHGHSAIVNPDGSIAAAADCAGDQMLVATLDVSKARGVAAKRRHSHPAFKAWWDCGRGILSGEKAQEPLPLPEPLFAPPTNLTMAAAQITCSRDMAANLERMESVIAETAARGADLVVFPELAVTGAVAGDILAVEASALRNALERIQAKAQQCGIAVVFGMPRVEGSQRWNSAYVVGRDGELQTCYDQMVVDNHAIFADGACPDAMWFRVKGVPGIVTVGSDARWNEIAELAAVRGARLVLNLAHAADGQEAATRRLQLWAQLASFRTFSATVNAARPRGVQQSGATAGGGSCIWDDLDGHRKQPGADVEVFSRYSASLIASAPPGESILYATRYIPGTNTYAQQFVAHRYPHMAAWYGYGASIIGGAFADCQERRNPA